LLEAVVLVVAFFAAVKTGDIENTSGNIIAGVGLVIFLFFLIIQIYLSVRALKTIDSSLEIGKTLSWITITLSSFVLLWILIWIPILFAGLSENNTKSSVNKYSDESSQSTLPSVTIDETSLASGSGQLVISGTATDVSSVFVSLATQSEVLWHTEDPVPVINGKWSVTVSIPNYTLPAGQYHVRVDGPDNPHGEKEDMAMSIFNYRP
jgi:uncharacterized membrane protein YhaH (DUF805 family)